MVGKKATIVRDTQTSNGMLYKKAKIKIIEVGCTCNKGKNNIKVEDQLGRIYWISNADLLID